VWLTSQDFIGLGFNIAGSMRDGIFVSQVHNRGPAKESGKFQVGKNDYEKMYFLARLFDKNEYVELL
jgi:hypothetical protein